ncbi:MAG: DUF1987 domain-containing protein [Bacteroidales bacterium]|nr:DUF1987 domain-containing protein [Bacteroidales bacterium]
MKDVFVSETKLTPKVILKEGEISLTGRSVPSNPGQFYQPVLKWVEEYNEKGPGNINIKLNFEYINTASTKWLYNILKILGSSPDSKNKLNISWYFEDGDDDMQELGSIFKSIVPSKFEIIKTSATI